MEIMNTCRTLLTTGLLIFFMTACGPEQDERPYTPEAPSEKRAVTPRIPYTVERFIRHDSTCYTQGFLFHEGKLLESTGAPDYLSYTRSLIGMVDLETGKFSIKAEIDRNTYFGEGIAVHDGLLYQLTYKNQVGFIYDANSFVSKGRFGYANAEGWGLTSDGKSLIMSDGTNSLTFLDPKTMAVRHSLQVTEQGYAVDLLNELEYIKGYIYANIYTKDDIVKIDPVSGGVLARLDLSELKRKANLRYSSSAETNGIAYNPQTDKIYVTGKLWPFICEIAFPH